MASLATVLAFSFSEAFAVLQTPQTPLRVVPFVPGLALLGLLQVCWPVLLWSLLLDLLATGKSRHWAVVAAAAIAALSVHLHLTLVAYGPFRAQPGFVVTTAGFAVLHAALWWGVRASGPNSRPALFGGLGFVALGIVIINVNYGFFLGVYPTLHEAGLLATVAFAARGASAIAGRLRVLGPRVAAGLAVAAVALVAPTFTERADDARPHFLSASEVGRIVSLGFVLDDDDEPREFVADDPDGHETLIHHSHLPELPDAFRLEDYNVLIIASEATRWDDTSLANPARNTMPALQRLARDAFVARRAYSPSSGTYHSLASLFTMKPPSMVDMETWQQPWYGELSTTETTVAELFWEAGYATFWIGHDHNHAFTRAMLGLDQGFDERKLVPERSKPHSSRTDHRIARIVAERLDEAADDGERRFFGFVFFASPHGPYVSHGFSELGSDDVRDRYRQEIRNVDVQIERVFEKLRQTGLADRTIVVYLSDHGEEFEEHGGVRHKKNVYEESVRVPLVLWIPGVEPGESSEPTSLTLLFPWLLLHAEAPALRDAAVDVANRFLGPVFRETDGAIVAELIGHDRMRSTLVWDDVKLDYDLRSRLTELYDVDVDPFEQRDLMDDRRYAERRDAALRALDGYLRVRSARRAYRLRIDKEAPPLDD